MFLRWSWVFLIGFFIFINDTECGIFKSSSSSNSRGSSSSSSRGSSSSSSRGSSSSSSRGSSSNYESGSASHGSYGWATGSSNSRYTTQRSYTQKSTRRTYPVTTMPTRKYYPVTTLPTKRKYPVTTMPTRRKTYATTTPSPIRTSRQSAFNPYYTTPSGRSNRTSNIATSKQPPFNPFFTSTVKSVSSGRNISSQLTSRQPPVNPFFTSTVKSVSTGRNISGIATSRQPPFNPFYSSTTPKYNGSLWQSSPVFSTKYTSRYTTKVTPRPIGFQNFTNSNQRQNITGNSKVTNRPWEQTSRAATVNSGFGKWSTTTQRTVFTTPRYNWTGPRYNSTTGNNRPGSFTGIYRPPTQANNTFLSRPNYITGTHPNQQPRPTYPTNTGGSTTIINNNNYHYYPGSYYHPSTGSTPHVTIINNNNYYTPNHHVIIPTRHYYSYGPPAIGISVINTHSYPVSSHYVTTYHYSTTDTGSSALGFYLGYQLGKLTRPSYYYHSTTYVNNEYVPRYDHYTVHHYYHNSKNIPKEAPIQPNAIVLCAGDSSSLCPPENMPLCTNNGAVMCVVNTQQTVPCSNDNKNNCTKSTISCIGNSGPECINRKEATVSIPCLSTAKIDAEVSLVNNSLIVVNANDVNTKSFCVTLLALPATKNSTNSTVNPANITIEFSYTTNDTGIGLLGYYLGHKLKKLEQPSYSFLNYDNNFNYIDKFDHYNIFHYDHNAAVLPPTVDIQPEQLMSCAGDSGTFCPANSSSLCLSDGAVVCAAEFTAAFYNPELQTSYIYSNISCEDLNSPACILNQNSSYSLQIPCFSTAKVYANSSYVIKNYGTGNTTIYYKTLEPIINSTENGTTTVGKLDTPRELCVIILALPGEKTVVKAPENIKVTGIANAPEYWSLPKYEYTTNDTGSNILGYYLIKQLKGLYYPTFYFINAYIYQQSGEIQKYDHYSVHYYDFGREILPRDLNLQAQDIRGCDGDSGYICPPPSSAMCLNDGSVWCVTDQLQTKSCKNKYNDTYCVKTEISCTANKSPLCFQVKSRKIILPCAATLTVTGEIMTVKHSFYRKIATAAKFYDEIQWIPNSNVNSTKAQHFCVTIINIPELRKKSDGEKLIENSDSLFGQLAANIFGV